MTNLKTGKAFTDAPTMTRGGFLKGILASGIAPSITLATIANAGSANASVGRGMMRNVGARISTLNNNDKEDEMWRELFRDYLTHSLSGDIDLSGLFDTPVAPQANGDGYRAAQIFRNAPGIRVIKIPNWTLNAAFQFYGATNLEELWVQGLSIGVRAISNCPSLTNVYSYSQTAAQIRSHAYFPWGADTTVTFHGNDGKRVYHNGTEWVVEA